VLTSQWPCGLYRDKTYSGRTAEIENLNIEDGAIVFFDISQMPPSPPPVYLAAFQNPRAHYIGVALDGKKTLSLYFTEPHFHIYERVINRILAGGHPRKIYYIANFYRADKNEKIKFLKDNSTHRAIRQPYRFAMIYACALEPTFDYRHSVYYLCEPLDSNDPIFFEWANPERTEIRFIR